MEPGEPQGGMSGPDQEPEASDPVLGESEEAASPKHDRATDEGADALLEAVEQLRRAEIEKRETEFSSEEFRRRANEVEEKARELFRLAARDEMAQGEGQRHPGDESGSDRSPTD